MKVNFFSYIFNVAINLNTERFEQSKEHIDTFLLFYEIEKIKGMTYDEFITHCVDLQLVIMVGDCVDINELNMADELSFGDKSSIKFTSQRTMYYNL